MRILRVAQNLYPEVPGGGSYHVHALSRDQAAMGHDVTVLTVSNDDNLPRHEDRHGYTVIRAKPTLELMGNDISIDVARFLRNSNGYDLMHAHSHLYFSTNLTALKRRMSPTPLAITNHGLYSQSASKRVFDVYLRTVGRWTFNTADVVFCYTETDHNRLRELGVRSNIQVISNGIDQTIFNPEGPGSSLIDPDLRTILFVGRIVAGKRPGDALEAFVKLRESLPNVQLVFCGEGPLRDELEKDVRKRGLDDVVKFLGHVEYSEMPGVYRSSDVLILPSRTEGMPRTVLEAFSCGVPVVASDLEQIAPLVRLGGETVNVGDVDAYADSLADVLEGSDGLSEEVREEIIEGYRWEDTVEKTTASLEELL